MKPENEGQWHGDHGTFRHATAETRAIQVPLCRCAPSSERLLAAPRFPAWVPRWRDGVGPAPAQDPFVRVALGRGRVCDAADASASPAAPSPFGSAPPTHFVAGGRHCRGVKFTTPGRRSAAPDPFWSSIFTMESISSRQLDEQRKQAEIRRQIAKLQAQLTDSGAQALDAVPQSAPPAAPTSPKRKRTESAVLAPDTPSKKRRTSTERGTGHHASTSAGYGSHHSTARSGAGAAPRPVLKPSAPQRSSAAAPPKPAPSNVLAKLSTFNNSVRSSEEVKEPERSTSFAAKPVIRGARRTIEAPPVIHAAARDDRLALIEELEPGPYDHKAPFDDLLFEKLEPHSGIYLSSRTTPHEDIQEYMSGRFFLSPSKLYSAIRLLPNNQGYDVPVAGDWVTIAVVAERGPIRTSQAPVPTGPAEERDDDENDEMEDPLAPAGKGKSKEKEKPPVRRGGRKYVNLKLIDFGARSKSSASGGKAVIRGDAFLTLLLFESDTFDTVRKDDGSKEKIYKGGSRGAFEAMAKLREGTVVALLNPRILKPFQAKAAGTPHPTTNILALTPESASAMAIIGQARDLGMCTAVKRDGKKCGSWTSGMSNTAASKKKAVYDPRRQWGLKPEGDAIQTDSGGATYVVSGHVVSGSSAARGMFVGENMGREAQARAQRKANGADTDRALKQLLERDKEGMRAVEKAREYAALMKEKEKEKSGGSQSKNAGKKKEKGKGKEKEKDPKAGTTADEASEPNQNTEENTASTSQKTYSAEMIKRLGFDPAAKPGQRREDSDIQTKLRQLTSQRSVKDIELGPRPGRRRSAVSAPVKRHANLPSVPLEGLDFPDMSDDDELERQEKEVFGKSLDRPTKGPSSGMVDLESSDDDLVIEP
ncbi:hypothetical protein EVG20_g2240 [Dentipellis fragilis]|uniref:Zinc finger Mcm10/DnaG-type domain-containing protein n=1 Tax=Dentipellis fragilis TaxID=205917 RepID=A0A4Y9Z7M8_9AGAM|nr:hypothetical protein EVG20_g2240 [Dentipellis fragilis]